MEIKILEGEVNVYKESPTVYVVAFGRLQENSFAKFKIKVEGVTDSSLTPTCGCTASGSTEKNTYEVEYKNTNILGAFSKPLILNYVEDNQNATVQIKMTGNVIK